MRRDRFSRKCSCTALAISLSAFLLFVTSDLSKSRAAEHSQTHIGSTEADGTKSAQLAGLFPKRKPKQRNTKKRGGKKGPFPSKKKKRKKASRAR